MERGNWWVSGDVLTGESFVEANEGQATTGRSGGVWEVAETLVFVRELIFFLLLCQYESPQLNPHPYTLGVTTLKIKRGYYRVFSKASLALIGPRSSAIMTRRCQNQEQMFSEQTQPNCVAAPRPSSQPPLRARSAATRVTCPRAP